MNRKPLKLFIFNIIFIFGLHGGNITGKWYIYEQDLNAVIVRVYNEGSKLYGVIDRTYGNYPVICRSCKGAAHNKHIKGMLIFKSSSRVGAKWIGKVLYPPQGSWYDCQIWSSGSHLKAKVCGNGKCKTYSLRRFRL